MPLTKVADPPPDERLADQAERAGDDGWLGGFYEGDARILERCYREHFATVARAISGILRDCDRETLIHEVFSRLIGQESVRRGFRGGDFAAWLGTLARNQAIDYQRRLAREINLTPKHQERGGPAPQEAADAHLLVERFRRECVPEAWHRLFDLRFLEQLSQREAATALRMRRTTLAYRELLIRRALKKFLLEGPS
ncbi:MAG TPA: sigma-70 family RNA polymerase sigma factor [Polyangia bacterium]|jgi:RNA polymerase sigma-70 factor (ECF subfamily)|nr:sigma-70 family RNA polymerase sigma factor [Polyangia bacterium]